MRIIIFLLFAFLLSQPVLSQPPTKAQMNAKMQEVKNKLSHQIADLEKQIATAKKEKPEKVKSLEEKLAMLKQQLAMMEGVNPGLSNMSEKTIQQAATSKEKKNNIPEKDVARINVIPKKLLTDAELAAFVKKIHSEVERLLPNTDKAEALKIYTTVKSEKKSLDYIANVASTIWMSGYPEIAIYILGKECTGNMANGNNLNNYSAFLTMAGGEHAALPILQNLNKKFPGNSTILNNIGQAWFGLGEMNNANRFLDSAMVYYPRHSQANMTKSEIQESEGNNAAAIESVKRAIQEHYNYDKENRVNKLGGKVRFEEIPFNYPMPWRPLSLEKFIITIPPYPMTAEDADINNNLWRDYKESLRAAMNKLSAEIEQLKIKFKAYELEKIKNPSLLLPYNNTIHNTAVKKLEKLDQWALDQTLRHYKKRQTLELDSMPGWTKEYQLATIGVGCPGLTSISVEYMVKANSAWKEMNTDLLTFYKEWTNAKVHYLMYANSGLPDFELQLAAAKTRLLDALYEQVYVYGPVCKEQEPGLRPRDSLPDFDEVNCKYKDEIFIPPFTTIKTECNKMTTEFDIDTELGLKIKLGLEDNLNSGKITKATIEIGKEWGPGEPTRFGPVGAELKGELGVGIEITSEGIQEVYVKGSTTIDLAGAIDGEFLTPLGPSDTKGLSGVGSEVKVSWTVGSNHQRGTISTSSSAKFANSINIEGHQIAAPIK